MSFFQSSDGTRLHERVWPSQSPPLGTVLVLHGYGEHIGRYDETAEGLAAAGWNVRGIDLRGHGQSGGRRGYCRRFSEFIDDAAAAVKHAKVPGLPLFLLAHSFGGLVAAHYVLAFPEALSGLILTSPYWDLALKVPAAKLWAGRVASTVLPTLALPTGIRGEDVSRDPEVAAGYERDPLVVRSATARWFTEASAAQETLFARAGEITLPLLVLAAGDDRIASTPRTEALFARLGSQDKTLRILPEQRHEVLNELPDDRRRTVAEVASWLHARGARRGEESCAPRNEPL